LFALAVTAAVSVPIFALLVRRTLHGTAGGTAVHEGGKGWDSENVQGVAGSESDCFVGTAFAPGATIEDLRRESREVVQRLARAFPDKAEAQRVRAYLLLALGDRSEEVRTWKRCIELSPGFVEAYCGIARAAFDKGDYETAAKWSREGLALDYSDARPQALLAESLLRLNRLQDLVTTLEPVLLTGTLSAETGVPLGQAYLQQREYAKAQKAFEAVLAATPGRDHLRKQAHYGLATLYAIGGQPEKAAEHRERFRKLSDADVAAGRVAYRTTDDLAAIRPLAVEIHKQCARVYRNQGHEAEAEEMWRKAAALDPKDVESRRQLALLYERTDRQQQALSVCEQLRDLEPGNPDHWLNVGLLNARLYRFDEALTAVERAVELKPHNQKYLDVYETLQRNR